MRMREGTNDKIDIDGISAEDLRYCGAWQKGKCAAATHHLDRQGRVTAHVCGYCLRHRSIKAKHTTEACKSRPAQSEKNDNNVA